MLCAVFTADESLRGLDVDGELLFCAYLVAPNEVLLLDLEDTTRQMTLHRERHEGYFLTSRIV